MWETPRLIGSAPQTKMPSPAEGIGFCRHRAAALYLADKSFVCFPPCKMCFSFQLLSLSLSLEATLLVKACTVLNDGYRYRKGSGGLRSPF